MNKKSAVNGEEDKVTVGFTLTGEFAKKLIESANKCGRSNRQEVLMRLEDSLFGFANITSVGNRTKR
ncbi:conserved hypothetical protein [Vibrio nigripulchritudo FTn2]|uniref:TraY domain-containing protein n=1 Tax=Vibrio nigripulchritudo TaxID=28173 RepID=UPI0003B1DAB8|nr:TraY domain-containing protein [Vibrio nigripulchritudo]BCL74196.1 hypothetical protein VNTUMSATTG_61330 [Vibrio nigripulchritudo]CCN39716.1 conserved hypothetical protein [Vibrio nigripulchritudo FTn2]